jgi:hypothetical protein
MKSRETGDEGGITNDEIQMQHFETGMGLEDEQPTLFGK